MVRLERPRVFAIAWTLNPSRRSAKIAWRSCAVVWLKEGALRRFGCFRFPFVWVRLLLFPFLCLGLVQRNGFQIMGVTPIEWGSAGCGS